MDIPQEVKDRVERVMQLKMDNADYTEAIIEAAQLPPSDAQIKYMVDRFLAWRLPENFTPDAGISYDTTRKHEPVGTNLLDASQAEQMVRYMVEGINSLPQVDPLEEIIKQEICKGRDAGQTIAETARKIAAAVREAKNG